MSIEDEPHSASAMKRDWDERALENARWYINTLSWEQSDEEFDLSGQREFDGQVLADLGILTDRRDPKTLRLLEIGCGVGRITRYLADVFGEVCATDVSGEMIRQAKGRLSSRTNVTFQETNGASFPEFEDQSFDVVFAAYVFQHVPSSAIIESNIREGYRLLKPRGVFKFVTNGVHNEEFSKMQKDTWTGASFPEASIRRLALELGAQLLGGHGDGTQYCWSFMRKPLTVDIPREAPVIELVARAENLLITDLTPRTGDTAIAIKLTGIDYNSADINNTVVRLREERLIPFYCGPTRVDSNLILNGASVPADSDRIQVSVMIPSTAPAGDAELYVEVAGYPRSGSVRLTLPELSRPNPIIHLVLDATDNSTALVRGAGQALIVVFSHAGGETPPRGVEFRFNSSPVTTSPPIYLAANGLWKVLVELPDAFEEGEGAIEVEVGGLASHPFLVSFSAEK